MIEYIKELVHKNNLLWKEPHVARFDNVEYTWWNRNGHMLTYYYEENHCFLYAWGPKIFSEMQELINASDDQIIQIWTKWQNCEPGEPDT